MLISGTLEFRLQGLSKYANYQSGAISMLISGQH
jgi:hypothetical protein